jgi:predicted nucleic acid-binding protein
MIFVDTGAWFSYVVEGDALHARAREWMEQNNERLLTTDYIIDETLTLLRARRQASAALSLGRDFFDFGIAQIYYLSPDDIAAAWSVFQKYSDKEWSFTDCSSKVVMEKLGVETAFAFDRHFHQFGSVHVVP